MMYFFFNFMKKTVFAEEVPCAWSLYFCTASGTDMANREGHFNSEDI